MLGHRPADPDEALGFVVLYDNHGHFFISQNDLAFIHAWLWALFAFGALTIVAVCFELWGPASRQES
jgi:hypothetical protein